MCVITFYVRGVPDSSKDMLCLLLMVMLFSRILVIWIMPITHIVFAETMNFLRPNVLILLSFRNMSLFLYLCVWIYCLTFMNQFIVSVWWKLTWNEDLIEFGTWNKFYKPDKVKNNIGKVSSMIRDLGSSTQDF